MEGDRRRATMKMTDDGWPWRREEATAMVGNDGRRTADNSDDNGDRMDDNGLCLVAMIDLNRMKID